MLPCGGFNIHRRLSNLASSIVVILVVIRSFWRPPSLQRSPLGQLTTSKPHITDVTANKSGLTYYVVDLPELTEWLVGNHTQSADQFYSSTLNENSGEVWLHRGFDHLLGHAHTSNANDADVILIPSYLHLLKYLRSMIAQKRITAKMSTYPDTRGVAEMVASRVVALGQHNKPHVLLVPTTNPSTSLSIGLAKLVAALEKRGVNLLSVGYERNTFWQRIQPARILPIPYVVVPDPSIGNAFSVDPSSDSSPTEERDTILFYAGDLRPKAVEWSGCNRSLIVPLINASSNHFNQSNMDIRLSDSKLTRLPHDEYNRRMLRSQYCLVLCGDTPTSRSLSSSMVHMCTPLFVGSRLRGRCEPPCHHGWGWTILHNGSTSSSTDATPKRELTHLPFERQMNWSVFPELNEAGCADDPVGTFNEFLEGVSTSPDARQRQRSELERFQWSFVYGVGSPIDENVQIGGAVEAIWTELQLFLFPHLGNG